MKTISADKWLDGVSPDDSTIDVAVLTLRNRLESVQHFLHLFRIRGKQLRYAMELLAPGFPLEFREELYPVVEELQDNLGQINDLAVSIARLGEHLDSSPEADEGCGNLHKKEQVRLDQARQEYRHWWTVTRQQNLRSGFEAMFGKPVDAGGSKTRPQPPNRFVQIPMVSRPCHEQETVAQWGARPIASGTGKTRIVGELGAQELLLPNLVNEALAANDRAKYLMSLLQSAREHADHPDLAMNDLRHERLTSGVPDCSMDRIVEQSRVEEPGRYLVPASACASSLAGAFALRCCAGQRTTTSATWDS